MSLSTLFIFLTLAAVACIGVIAWGINPDAFDWLLGQVDASDVILTGLVLAVIGFDLENG